MSTTSIQVKTLLQRAQVGDEEATHDLVRHWEPALRREVRLRMHGNWLHRRADSEDVCQSVFAAFFACLSRGKLDLIEPEAVLSLLMKMVRQRTINVVVRHQADCRDVRRTSPMDQVDVPPITSRELDPQVSAEIRELITAAQDNLSAREQAVAAMRRCGKSWQEIAQQHNTTPDAVRKCYSRTIDRTVQTLVLGES